MLKWHDWKLKQGNKLGNSWLLISRMDFPQTAATHLLRPTNESELKMPRVIAGLKLIFDAFSSGMLKALVSY